MESPDADHRTFDRIHADDRARAVYADELEAQGQVNAANFVRWSGSARTAADSARLAGLYALVGARFRSEVATAEIIACRQRSRFPEGPPCPGSWEALPRGADCTRICGICHQQVTYIERPDTQVRELSLLAIDPSLPQDPARYFARTSILGRPLLVEGQAVVAPVSPAPVSVNAEAWAQAAQGEHASVASFARTLCQLMALGAPLELLERTQQALADEIRHTEMTLLLLAKLGGAVTTLGPLPEATAPLSASLEALIAEVRFGAEAERTAVDDALKRAEAAIDPEVRAFHERIAADEGRHVTLAEDTVAWLELQLSGSSPTPLQRKKEVLAQSPKQVASSSSNERSVLVTPN